MQKQDLEKLQEDINERVAILEARKAEYEDWLQRRNDFLKQAETNLVEVYKTMKADAAAPQLQELDPGMAAAIIMKTATAPVRADPQRNEREEGGDRRFDHGQRDR